MKNSRMRKMGRQTLVVLAGVAITIAVTNYAVLAPFRSSLNTLAFEASCKAAWAGHDYQVVVNNDPECASSIGESADE